jgi:hypothetical protein
MSRPAVEFAAKLLFQYRVVRGGKSNRKRVCEERIVLLKGRDPLEALRRARSTGRGEEFRHEIDDGAVFFEFVGILDLVALERARERNEVWSRLHERLRPSERRRQLVPPERALTAVRQWRGATKGKIRVPLR